MSEPALHHACYAGHLNLMLPSGLHGLAPSPPLALLGGAGHQLLAAPSDDGRVFVWDYASARLLGALGDGAGAAAACVVVAAHPTLPLLASGGMDAIVRLWSPEAAERAREEALLQQGRENYEELVRAGRHQVPTLSAVALDGEGVQRCAFM